MQQKESQAYPLLLFLQTVRPERKEAAMRTLSVICALAASVGLTACSSSSGGSGGSASRDRNLITFEELQEFQALDMMEAIRRLRPRWRRTCIGD